MKDFDEIAKGFPFHVQKRMREMENWNYNLKNFLVQIPWNTFSKSI